MNYNMDSRIRTRKIAKERGTLMKGKKLWAILLTICLVVGSIGVTSVMASADKDIDVSITTDKKALKAGDVVTVSVNLDRFESTVSKDEKKLITTIQMNVPFDSDIFEYVSGSVKNGLIAAVDEGDGTFADANIDGNVLKVAAVYKNTKAGAISETTESTPFLTFQLKVKDSVTADVTADFEFSKLVLKNMYLDDSYTYDAAGSSVNVYTNPVITVDGSETIAESYTTAVNVATNQDAELTVNGKTVPNPCTVSAAGDYTVVAKNAAGLETTKKFSIAPVVDSIEVAANPTTVEYVRGTKLDLTGGKLKVVYSNGETAEIAMTAEGVTTEGYNATPATYGKQTITVKYEGKTTTFEVTVKDKELASIEWAKKPAASIIEGQELAVALKGAAIKVVYSDGTTDEISVTDQMCSGLNDTVGTQTITVTYGAKTLTFDIEVKAKSITGIEVTTKPAKTEYVEGTDLDVTGGVLTVSYDNGKTETVDMTSAMCSGYEKNPAAYGEQTITVTYKEHTAVFTVKVRKKAMASIELVSIPAGTEVLEGKELDLTDAKIKVVYDNGTSKEAELTKDMLKDFDNTKVGEQTVTVSYSEDGVTKTTTFTATVKAKSVKSVELVSAPEKTEVLEGKDLDLTGAKIKVVYDNGTEDLGVNVTSDMISGFDKNTVGKQTITIKYNGYTVAQTFEVTVIEKSVSDVKIAENNITNIKEGKAFTFDGTILVSYNNDTTEKVAFSDKSVKVDASKVDTATPGTYKVTVVYTDKKNVEHTLTYEVTVIEKVLEKIAITTKPSKTSIIEGTKLDVTDGVITLYYDNDTTATVAMTNDMISGFDNSKVGDQTVTVTYKGKTAELAVTVAAKTVTDVTLVSAPTATTVTEGLALDLTGGKIHVTYDNGTEEDMDITEGMLTLDTNVVGKQTATVTYGGKTVTFEVEVLAKAATGLALSFGEVTDLKEGTELADAGLEVYLVYNNGTKDTLKLTDVTIKGYDPAVLGKQDVKVSYKTADGAAYEIGFIVRVLKNSEIDSTVTGVSDEEYLVVSKETSVKKMKEVVEALSKVVEKYEKYEVLDIKLLSKLTGAEIQPDGSLKITLDIPAGLNKANKLTVYRLVEGDGSMKKLDTSVEGDKITFATDHFSTYVIVEEKVETPTTQEPEKDTTTAENTTTNNEGQTTVKADETTAAGNTTAQETTTAKGTSVKTGDAKNVAAVLGMIVAAGAGFVVFSRRKVQR